ncbi:hypothetical protein AVCANL277_06525 [Campylobacter canadensis]|uniref:hypothetical protein n=1 Tax=Campylobacter canadensis TaxID=449520 RepID=UPI001CCC7024|nr:hypothetical protein [Campylobacter canadensis]MBZ8000515.1 hypothetical protein [Campylobacter canadensis]
MKKITLKSVEQKVTEYLKDKKTFHPTDLIINDDEYNRLVLARYKEDNANREDEILFELINEEINTSYYFYKNKYSKYFKNSLNYEDKLEIVFEDLNENLYLTDIAEQQILDKNIQDAKDILNKLLDDDYSSKTIDDSAIEDELKCKYKKDYIELIDIDYPKFSIQNEKLVLNLYAKYTYADFDSADDFLDIAYLDDETKKILKERAKDTFRDEAFNSGDEIVIYEDFYYRYDINRDETSLYEDFCWTKEHNIDNKIIDELLYDLEEKIKNTLKNDTLEQIKEAKEFIILQGTEILYEYLLQELQ